MRSVLLMLGAVAVIALVAGLYIWMQPVAPEVAQTEQRVTTMEARPAPPPPPSPTTRGTEPVIGTGERLATKVFDDKTNRLAWQARFDRYTPQADGSVDVQGIDAEFFLDDGRVVVVRADRGKVVVPGEASRDPQLLQSSNTKTTFSRGELHDVVLSLYADETRSDRMLECTVNNLAFDNDTLRIATEAAILPDGTRVAADQIPVQIRGTEYDFDGKGLTIRWNGRDRRLQGLEIAHGQSMTYRPTTQPVAGPTTRRATTAVASAAPTTRPARAQAPATSPSTRPARLPGYRATFYDNVSVLMSEKPLASAEMLRIDFRPPDEEDSAEAAATADAKPAAAASTAPRARPTTARGFAGPLARGNELSKQPLVINWTGKLSLVPLAEDSMPLEPGQQIIELVSTAGPVQVDYEGNAIAAASLMHNSIDDSFLARSSDRVSRVTVKGEKGLEISTPLLRHVGRDSKVSLEGPSSVRMMVQGDAGEAPRVMTATWQDRCVLTLLPTSADAFSLQHADIRGDVKIEQDQLKLSAPTLIAEFVPAPAGAKDPAPQIKQLVASGGVQAELIDEPKKPRNINADTLSLAFVEGPGGKLMPRMLKAEGQVHTWDASQDVRAGQVEVTLAPTTQPGDRPAIERIFAQRDVVFKAQQVSGSAVQLEVIPDGASDLFDLKLVGSASVGNSEYRLTGPIINVSMRRQHIEVRGSGALHREAASGPATAPTTGPALALTDLDLTWGTEMIFDGLANSIKLDGGVHIVGQTDQNASFDVKSDRLEVALVDPPTTAPTTAPAAMSFAELQNKKVRSASLEGNARIDALQADALDKPLQRVYLAAPKLNIDPQDQADQFRVSVPVAGRMLYEDLRPATQPSEPGIADIGDFRGPTAFSWSREFVFDQAAQQAVMQGDVNIVHEDETSEPFRFDTQTLTAHFAPTTQPSTRPAGPVAPALQRLTADGGVQFSSRQISFTAIRMDFDPSRETLAAFGEENSPVRIFDSSGINTGSLREASWNTRTQEIEIRDVLLNFRR